MDDQRQQRDETIDETIERMRAVLTPLPTVARSSIARVLAATATRRRPSVWARFGEWMITPSLSLARAGALAAAALVFGFLARGTMRLGAVTPTVAQAPVSARDGSAAAAPVLSANANGARVAVQLVFDAPAARSVSVVGDFNDWQPAAAPMQRLEAGQPWSALVMITPGRHTYAFLVDGARWVADPRAPRAKDDDFGKPESVLIVQAP